MQSAGEEAQQGVQEDGCKAIAFWNFVGACAEVEL